MMQRADSDNTHMGLTSWNNAPDGKIINAYLDLAEERARREISMTMEDWARRFDLFFEFDEREILQDAGKVTAKIAKDFAESEFEKYRIIQDQLFKSDFDKLLVQQQKGRPIDPDKDPGQ